MHPFGPRTALIGHTGFVGSNLAAQYGYTDCYNSKNIHTIAGQSFDTIVCAGVQAVKYWANAHPEEDWQGIQNLLTPLESVRAARFILLSSIDVYPCPIGVTEDDAISSENHAYGRHRLAVEAFVQNTFPQPHIVRLPGLFGPGLKKNVLFDLLHRHCLEAIQPASVFQYYHLKHLTSDLQKVIEHGLPLLNLATEPIPTRAILDHFAAEEAVGATPSGIGRYDFLSKHAALWGGSRGYLYEAPAVLADMAEFFTSERARLT